MDSLFATYERVIPWTVRKRFRPVIHSAGSLRSFLLYAAIGLVTTCTDVGLFRILLPWLPLPAVISLAYGCAGAVQFLLNKYLNFRDAARGTAAQVSSYALIAATMWLLTLALVETGVHLFGLPPLLAKLATIPVTVVIGYLATRDIAFGPGIRALLRHRRR